MEAVLYEKLLSYALRLLSRKRYTENELKKKLQHKKIEAPQGIKKAKVITQVIERLKTLNYVDDAQFVRDYIVTRQQLNPRGKWLMKMELQRKGIEEVLIQKILDTLDIDELKNAVRYLQKKKTSLVKLSGQKQKEKMFYYLSSRGFQVDTIYKAIDEWYEKDLN